MEKTGEITYLFGAGASYYSMPLVENFGNRFKVFTDFLRNTVPNAKNGFMAECEQFSQQVKNHLSFDTFFKKMFHLPENDDVQKFKVVLLIFFLYEGLLDISNNEVFNNTEANKDKYGVKRGNIDPRYEALVAGLLYPSKDKFSLITKVNFLTWNYDVNLITAIKNFKSSKVPFADFFKLYEESLNRFVFDEKLQLIHLNGRVFHPQYSKTEVSNEYSLMVELTALINEYYNKESKVWDFSKQISFSWETLDDTDLRFGKPVHIAEAIDAVRRSDIIVIIGYSFPLYNRLIDSAILNQSNLNGKTVFIQDPHAEELKSILANDFELVVAPNKYTTVGSKTSIIVNAIKNCNSFFVPSNIFVSPLLDKNPGQ